MNQTVNIAANGSLSQAKVGNFSYLYFRAATNAFQYSFDGNTWQNGNLNDNIGALNPQPTQIYFRALNGLASAVSFDYSNSPITPQSVSQKEASSYFFGTEIVNPANGSTGTVIGVNNGNQRKQVVFTLQGTGTVRIKDMLGTTCLIVTAATSPQTIPSDGTFTYATTGAITEFCICETYYLNQ